MENRKKDENPAPKTSDEDLDEALEESFPASDPPSMTEPHSHMGRKDREKKPHSETPKD